VHRLLSQLEELSAVERSSGRWRLGPAMVRLGAAVPAEPRLRSVARRPLMDLASATGEIVALSVEMAGEGMVIDVAIVAPDISCVAAPLRLAHGGVGAVWMMILGGAPISAPFVAATRRTAGRIASQLSRPF
jgi:DNA-binding IclR family transcriptional regulator